MHCIISIGIVQHAYIELHHIHQAFCSAVKELTNLLAQNATNLIKGATRAVDKGTRTERDICSAQ